MLSETSSPSISASIRRLRRRSSTSSSLRVTRDDFWCLCEDHQLVRISASPKPKLLLCGFLLRRRQGFFAWGCSKEQLLRKAGIRQAGLEYVDLLNNCSASQAVSEIVTNNFAWTHSERKEKASHRKERTRLGRSDTGLLCRLDRSTQRRR